MTIAEFDAQANISGDTTGEEFIDPLLCCLEVIAQYHQRSIPGTALIAGLPLVEGRLTPDLFARAAERAGLSSKLISSPLSELTSLLLPAILLLQGNKSVLFLKRVDEEHAEIIIPEIRDGVETIELNELEEQYSGYAILVKLEHRFQDHDAATANISSKNWFWGTVAPLWRDYLKVMISATFVNLIGLAAPLFIMNVYDRVLPNKALTTLWVLAIGMGIALIFDFVFRTLRNALIGNAGRRADVSLASRIFSHVLKMDISYRPANTGDFANRLRDYEVVREYFTSNTVVTLTDFLFIGLYIFIIQQIAGIVAIVPAIAAALVILIGLIIQFPLNRAVTKAQSEATYRNSVLFEALGGLETIKTTRAESQMQRDWELFVEQNAQTNHRLRFISSVALNLTSFIQQFVTVAIIVIGVHLFDQGELSAGALIAAVILAGRGMAPLGQIAATLARSQQAFHALRALNSIMAMPEEGEDQGRPVNKSIMKGSINFDNVTFAYPGSEIPALKDFTLSIQPGERVGLIGKIGSGKTTVGRLLARLYVPTAGSLIIDDVDIRQYHPSEVRRKIAFVAQDSTLFSGSVRDNIAFGTPHISDDKIVQVAELTGVAEFVKSHPLGFNMPVGEGGRYLSSGQRQSITLARAFLFDPAILFLDEPTGAMDMASENILIKRLKIVLKPDQTLVLTTHRSKALSLVDRLVVIDKGHVVADGPRDKIIEILKKKRPK